MDFKRSLEQKTQLINEHLNKYVEVKNNRQSSIYEAMRYSLFAGGKRLRPVILLSCCELVGGDTNKALPFACAIEMIHTYSLIHDDLPAMDNDDYRRGKPTNHKVYGEALAVLAGDALLNKAFETAVEGSYNLGIDSKRVLDSLAVLSNASGTEGMIGGQVIDLDSENKVISIDALENMHLLKTGALIVASAKIGAIIGGGSIEEKEIVGSYAKNLGLAFQIKDDILDVVGDKEKIGKPIGSDSDNNKSTYVTLLGINKSIKLEKELTDRAISQLAVFGNKANFLIHLAEYLLKREY